MNMIQAQILAEIVTFIEEKFRLEPEISFMDARGRDLDVTIRLTLVSDLPARGEKGEETT